MRTKFYRSRTDTMIAGVCGGLGRYLSLDPTLVRLFFVLMALANGLGVLIYFLLWFIAPLEGREEDETLGDTVRSGSEEIAERTRMMGEDLRHIISGPNPRTGMILGVSLVVLGLVFLLDNLPFAWLRWLDFDVLWPLLLILGGITLVAGYLRGK